MEDRFYSPSPTLPDLQELRRRSNRVGLAFFVLSAVFIAASNIAILLYLLAAKNNGWEQNPPWLNFTVTMVALYLVAAPLAYLLLRRVPSQPPARRPITPLTFLLFLLIAFFFMVGGSIIGNAVNDMVSRFVGAEQGSGITEAVESSTLWLTCVYSLIVAPLMEELLFRKLLVDRIAPMGQWAAILTSGIFFGLFHGNLDQFFYAALLGCLLAYIYLNTGNVFVTVAIHAVINFFGGVLPTLVMHFAAPGVSVTDAQTLQQLSQSSPLAFLAISLVSYLPYVFAIAGLIVFIKYYRKLKTYIEPSPLPVGTRFNTVACNPGFILFFITCFGEMILTIITYIIEARA